MKGCQVWNEQGDGMKKSIMAFIVDVPSEALSGKKAGIGLNRTS